MKTSLDFLIGSGEWLSKHLFISSNQTLHDNLSRDIISQSKYIASTGKRSAKFKVERVD